MEIIYNNNLYICDKIKKMIAFFFKKGANYAEYGFTPALRNFAIYEIYQKDGKLTKDPSRDFIGDGWEFQTYEWAAYIKDSVGEVYAQKEKEEREYYNT